MEKAFIPTLVMTTCLLMLAGLTQAQVFFEETSTYTVRSIEGSASWTKDTTSGDFIYDNGGSPSTQKAIVYSTDAFQSDDGFRLTVEYTIGSIDDMEGHNFSFGLISDETDLSTYTGFNPFRTDSSVYSLGINLTTDEDPNARGLNFTDGTKPVLLDESGTRTQFEAGVSTKVYMEIGIGGSWQYRINDKYETSGVLLNGFDPAKSYHVVVYGQDDNGGGKSIQSIKLEKAPAAGERAVNMRGTWYSGIHPTLIDDSVTSLKTLDGFGVSFTDGASLSAQHYAPHKLIESLPGGDAVVPTWGELSFDEPEKDEILDYILKIKAAGFKVKAYVNSENFVGTNQDQFLEFVENWINYCDTNTEVQAFINSQPYHTGIWNRTTQQYEDATATFPNRKYMFCYAEYVLKEYALRYGKYIGSWIFDSAKEMVAQGDNATSGLIEEQRIYQAFSDAVHAGNPEIPVSFNNGRSTVNYDAYPFAHPIRFEDFTFGHAFGGNNNHAEKIDGNQFNLNYQHITRMTATDAYVHDGGNWEWDDLIVGNFHSKVSTTAWKYGPVQAWEQDDFNQWNLEAMQAGGSMTWDGSFNRSITAVYDWVYVLFEGLDDYLAQYEYPGAPNWARAYTVLPDATVGVAYSDTLFVGIDFWDPEGDEITALIVEEDAPSWLTISEPEPGLWVLGGTPDDTCTTEYEFSLQIKDASGESEREVHLMVIDPTEVIPVTKIQVGPKENTLFLGNSFKLNTRIYPKDASNQKLSWSSSDTLLAKVDSTGLVTSVDTGTVIITATTLDGGFSDSSEIRIEIEEIPPCELDNIAFCGIARQSSTDYDGVASRAIDGNTDGNYANNSVTHTLEENNPWWQVDLRMEYNIGNINIFNRAGKNANRLTYFTVIIYSADGTEVFSKEFTSYPNPSVSITTGGVMGQTIKVQLNASNPLSLAEVQVFEFVSVTGLSISPDSVSLTTIGETNSLNATVLPSNATNQSISWNSSDTSVVAVNSNGGVTAHDSGSAIITATTLDGAYTDSCVVSVSIQDPNTHVLVGETVPKDLILFPNPAGNYINYTLKNIQGATSISVYSILGKLIFVQEIEGSTGQIDINSLSSGVYILKIQGKSTLAARFVKE